MHDCRSELAREKLESAAFILKVRMIVNVFREQARSYKALQALAAQQQVHPHPSKRRQLPNPPHHQPTVRAATVVQQAVVVQALLLAFKNNITY